jgi:hypothetical protein
VRDYKRVDCALQEEIKTMESSFISSCKAQDQMNDYQPRLRLFEVISVKMLLKGGGKELDGACCL